MAKKYGMGKGLGSLIPIYSAEKVENSTENLTESENSSTNRGSIVDNSVDNVVELTLSKVEPRPNQPRMIFDEKALGELAESIKAHGVISPILVAARGDHYEIVAGERRWRAAKLAGLKKIPAIVREYSEQDLSEVSLIENIQRENLNPIEEAQAYKQLIEDYRLKQDEVAKRVAKSRTAVTNSLRLLKLDERVQALVMDGSLSEGHARALLGLESKKLQLEAAVEVTEKHLSVRETEKLVKKLNMPPAERAEEVWRTQDQTAYDNLEQQLKKRLGTKVTIRRTKEDKGQLIIDYYSVEELERISELLQ